MEEGAGSDRLIIITELTAAVKACFSGPGEAMSTPAAGEAVFPFDIKEILAAVVIRGEGLVEFAKGDVIKHSRRI